eukprot:snap_masked-scaffold75_size407189-processed-gene-2.14 protein:Tk10133 transcript:snap_masked-scaffold75_size407189-processed-gene-2.14-mRNA-1 annotation:"malonyl- mitochondrial"
MSLLSVSRCAPTLGGSTQDLLSFAETFSTTARGQSIVSEEGVGKSPEGDNSSVQELLAALESALELSQQSAVSRITVENHVRSFCQAFEDMSEDESILKVMEHIAAQSIDQTRVAQLSQAYAETQEPLARARLEDQLRNALEPPYYWLFQQIGQLSGGVKFLVDFRDQVISFTQASDLTLAQVSALKAMSSHLKRLLNHWFSVGFLELGQITWDSPCAMLQKVSDYEAVHPMRNWTDLKSRVGPYRRCFVYTHLSMPGEPIVVLHVALAETIPESIGTVVKHHRLVKRFSVDSHLASGSKSGREGEDPSLCQAAIFYSITSTQKGLQGIELGTQLIKQAVHKLKEELPGLNQFSTLSPIPGFRKWLLMLLQSAQRDGLALAQTHLFTPDEAEELVRLLMSLANDQRESADHLGALIQHIKTNQWTEDPKLVACLEKPLMRVCARYLYLEKRRSSALDSVANFHLRNGAVLWRLNWEGDLSVRGLSNSCGIMVNYKYFLDDLAANSTHYQEKHEVQASEQVTQLAHQAHTLQNKAQP